VIRFREFIVAEYDGADVTENTILGLDRLPRADRITLVQDLWDCGGRSGPNIGRPQKGVGLHNRATSKLALRAGTKRYQVYPVEV